MSDMTIRRTVRLNDELDRRLKDYIESADVSPSEVIREALEEYLEARARQTSETIADRLRRTGLVGKFRLGVGDLATNPKHMEGFGK